MALAVRRVARGIFGARLDDGHIADA